jgi:hypothetical protein
MGEMGARLGDQHGRGSAVTIVSMGEERVGRLVRVHLERVQEAQTAISML